MDQNKVIKKLAEVVEQQQRIITKLAQQLSPMSLSPSEPPLREADTILKALDPMVRSAVEILEVHGDVVKVKFVPGKSTQAVYDAVLNTVQKLQSQNLLAGKQYKIEAV